MTDAMEISESTVRKIMITNVCGLDPIAVYLEDFNPGQGKITITCYGDAWSYYWSRMGENNTINSFFQKCGNDYLAGKLGQGIQSETNDNSKIVEAAKKQIINDRLGNGAFASFRFQAVSSRPTILWQITEP